MRVDKALFGLAVMLPLGVGGYITVASEPYLHSFSERGLALPGFTRFYLVLAEIGSLPYFILVAAIIGMEFFILRSESAKRQLNLAVIVVSLLVLGGFFWAMTLPEKSAGAIL